MWGIQQVEALPTLSGNCKNTRVSAGGYLGYETVTLKIFFFKCFSFNSKYDTNKKFIHRGKRQLITSNFMP
jgi:hypothetical protein